jgi:uncharacterized protein
MSSDAWSSHTHVTGESEIPVPAATGKAFQVAAGSCFEIVAAEGPQVADMWAFVATDLCEFLSTEHTRSCLDRLTPRVGDAYYSNRRRPILSVVADTSPGTHDLLLSACDEMRYRRLGHAGPHRTCVDNMREALDAFSLTPPEIPCPVNIFENVAIGPDGTLEIIPPEVKPGEAITLRAEMDVIVVVSACPMDIVPTNGSDLRPKALIMRYPVGARA